MPGQDAQEKQAFKTPTILPDELAAFHEGHFSEASLSRFHQSFISPHPQAGSYDEYNEYCWEEEDDDLGYYEDGVKRTLTDAQIEIFRHSELRELERAKEKASKQPHAGASSEEPDTPNGQLNLSATTRPRDGKKGKKRSNKQARREPKPDLRKRTWDVVEAGLDSLDYD